MKTDRVTVNGEMSLPCPEGFAAMSAEELAKVYTCDSSTRQGIWDKARHVMITVLWQRYNPLLAWLADMKTMVKRNEQLTRKGYRNHGYQLDGFFSQEVCGLRGEGYRFTYQLGDVVQEITTVLIKKGGVIYSLNCIGRPAQRAANRALFAEILAGIKMI